MLANQPVTHGVDALRALLPGQLLGDHLWLVLVEFGGTTVVAGTLPGVLFRRSAQ